MAPSGFILVAEDEESDVLLLEMALEKARLSTELVVARDGQEAVDYLAALAASSKETGSRRPGLLLLDLKMPRMSGFDVLSWLANHPELKELPVVVLSSSSLECDVARARALGAREYLVKPHGIEALVQMVQVIHTRYFHADAGHVDAVENQPVASPEPQPCS